MRIRGVRKSYRDVGALDEVDLDNAGGEVVVVVFMDHGKTVESGSPEDFFGNPHLGRPKIVVTHHPP